MSMRNVFLHLVLLLALPAPVMAQSSLPRIAIIIDDIGDRHAEGLAAVSLPGAVACAFLPHTPHSRELALLAHENGKEVMLHLPLQSLHDKPLGPGAITLDTTETEFRRTLAADLQSIPFVRGVNNHMGSLLTLHPGHMTWLMQYLAAQGEMFFVDSYTNAESVALAMAQERGVPAAKRDVFLDNIAEQAAIGVQFERLVSLAHERGTAIGIGHPYPETLKFLAENLPELQAAYGVELVPVSVLLTRITPLNPVPASATH